ncbi:unnamed protein product [Notodromas monacha]|uniref:EGF-like domain-containing protein n=1 Tax=Notodromas monacha TaxID=399045 RepID=A0A7R9BY68_9CRUS|nr:unnamed protein product [Notodromas monacha]CAG0922607.1 unnamed protein product [Notodromas monacha]
MKRVLPGLIDWERVLAFRFVFPVILWNVNNFANGHVRLTFPPARQYALDFADNIRTEPPCGMPRNLLTQSISQESCNGGQWQTNQTNTNTGTVSDINSIVVPYGRCTCQAGSYGENCQFTNECEGANDCGSNGVCDFVNGTSFPKKMCFCRHTYYGPKCSKNSDKYKMEQLKLNQFTRLGGTPPEVEIYWRVFRFDNEIEFVVRVKTTNWVGIGWRPSYLTSSCRKFPVNATDPDPLNGPTIEEVTNTPGFDSGGFNAYVHRGISEKLRVKRSGSTMARQENDAEWATGEWVSRNTDVYNDDGWSPKAVHPMDCTDMVVAFARGETIKIGDYYTRDRSTPRPDSFYGGTESLLAADGYERNGTTTIYFRRNILLTGSALDQADYNITSRMYLIWAYGQNPVSELYKHDPPSGLALGAVSNPNFYAMDEFKYHGSGNQRGVHSVDLFADEAVTSTIGKCRGEWIYPKNCNMSDGACDFSVTWVYNGTLDELDFHVLTRNSDRWTGVGFAKDLRANPFTDGVVIFAGTGGQFVGDVYWNGTAIVADNRQDIANISIKQEAINSKSFSKIYFTRKRLTGDDAGQDLPLVEATQECVYMAFPIMGGEFRYGTQGSERVYQMFPPEYFPHVTKRRICFGPCTGVSAAYYQMEIDINAGSFSGNGQPGSLEYAAKMKEISDTLINGLDRVRLDANDSTLPLKSIRAVKLTKPVNSTNGMLIRVVALMDSGQNDPSTSASILENRMFLAQIKGYYNNFQLTNNSITFAKVSVVSGGFYGWPRRDLGIKQIKDLIFLFTIATLGLTLLLQALCTVRRTVRKGGSCVVAP